MVFCVLQFCPSLKSIDIPPSVTRIGAEAFWGCDSLRAVTVPATATLGADAFPEATKVTRLGPGNINNK